MSIYSKARAKITTSTVLLSLGIIIGLWLLLFVTDYIMFRNNMPLLFSSTKVEDISGKRVTIESGLGYYVISDESKTELYLFGNKIN